MLTDREAAIVLDPERIRRRSVLFREFLAEHEEIMKHKWIESEKAGRDIGYDRAMVDWVLKYRAQWRRQRKRTLGVPAWQDISRLRQAA